MQLLFPRGFSMNFVLLNWALCGGLFVYAFLANFRTMLLMPQYEKPVNSAQDVLDRGMIPFVWERGAYFRDHLLQSTNPTYQKLGEIVVVPKDYEQYWNMMKEDVLLANTHVYLGYLNFDDKSLGKFHESKDVLEGISKSGGNIVNKKWSLGEEFSYHLLVFQQVRTSV
jgi:hypothetical protein